MSAILTPIRFGKKDIGKMQEFRCGSLPHQSPLADWIKSHSLAALESKTRIWIYENTDKKIVGYGSLGKTKVTFVDTGMEVKVPCIPCLAIHEDYWGKPDDVLDKEERYSRQIVRHLQKEAIVAVKASEVLKPPFAICSSSE
jgi:hypothetical protein